MSECVRVTAENAHFTNNDMEDCDPTGRELKMRKVYD